MKQCLPIMCKTAQEVESLIGDIAGKSISMIEVRLDCLTNKNEIENLFGRWDEIVKLFGKEIILTFRTDSQGGKKRLEPNEYMRLIENIIDGPKPTYVDIEIVNVSDNVCKTLIKKAKRKGVKTIISYHNMSRTPKAREIEDMLIKMKSFGADLPKVAYMANDDEDVENLIFGAGEAFQKIGEVIAISMGKKGTWTRQNGRNFGSVVSFFRPLGSEYKEDENLGQLEFKLN